MCTHEHPRYVRLRRAFEFSRAGLSFFTAERKSRLFSFLFFLFSVYTDAQSYAIIYDASLAVCLLLLNNFSKTISKICELESAGRCGHRSVERGLIQGSLVRVSPCALATDKSTRYC